MRALASSRLMSLATRCTSCGTIFKVVQDQLKVSEGWVRCGRCQQVFNALEGLFDLERDPPPQRRPADSPAHAQAAPTPSGDVADVPTASAPASSFASAAPPAAWVTQPAAPVPHSAIVEKHNAGPAQADAWEDVPATHEDDALDSRWLVRPARDGRSARERHARHDPDSDFTDARFPLDAALDETGGDVDAAVGADDGGRRPMPPVPGPGRAAEGTVLGRSRRKRREPEAETPAFLKRAKRQAQWRHPAVRATLSLTAVALLGLLGLQASVAFRDWIAAYRPDAAPLLGQLCQVAGCELQPLRRIDQLAVDSVALVRNPAFGEAGHAYRLTVSVHNSAAVALAAPHLELSLTDQDGQLVARRVLAPADLALPSQTVAARASTALQAQVFTAGPRVAGYTVELFYP